MNKKLTVSLAAAIIALTAIFAGSQTIKSLNNETTQAKSSDIIESDSVVTMPSDSSAKPSEESVKVYSQDIVSEEASSAPSKISAPESRISAEEAEAKALREAGFSASEVYDKEVELDYEKNTWVYEVSFEKNKTDYDYVIDAVSGEVLHFKVEPEAKPVDNKDKTPSEPKTEPSTLPPAPSENKAPENKISAKEAEAIALRKAGFSASEVREKETELDYERGIWVYEVTFENGRTDYEYIIDAVSGEILYTEVEND